MVFKEFNKIVKECKVEQPILFGLGHDKMLNSEEIVCFERSAQVTLPEKYKAFIMHYGGGYFGFANIYSLDSDSDFFLLKHNTVPFDKYIRIADNGCGDYYLLYIENGVCLENLFFFDHETKHIFQTNYNDVLEYLVQVGLDRQWI